MLGHGRTQRLRRRLRRRRRRHALLVPQPRLRQRCLGRSEVRPRPLAVPHGVCPRVLSKCSKKQM